ncbi:MAG: DUF523 domain-containing protein [Clostridiales Family XIII bacterium]|nr:DUF523 domain-containing protein [Clostridiales Family XIII bacterium]
MKKVLVSECLYGGRAVRHDGGEAAETDPRFLKWKGEGRLLPICPEVFGGLPTPRPDCQRAGGRVVTRAGADVTKAFVAGAREALRMALANDVAFAIMKQGSPSCGVSLIYDGSFSGGKTAGQGLATEFLRGAGFEVFCEEGIGAAAAALARIEAGGYCSPT